MFYQISTQREESWKYKYSIFDELGGDSKCGLTLSCGHSLAQSRTIPQNHPWTFYGSFIAYVSEKTDSFLFFFPTYLSLLYSFTCTSDARMCTPFPLQIRIAGLNFAMFFLSVIVPIVEHFQSCSKHWQACSGPYWENVGALSFLHRSHYAAKSVLLRPRTDIFPVSAWLTK